MFWKVRVRQISWGKEFQSPEDAAKKALLWAQLDTEQDVWKGKGLFPPPPHL